MKVLPRLRLRVLVTALVAVAFVLGSAPSAGAAVILPPGSIPVPNSGTFL